MKSVAQHVLCWTDNHLYIVSLHYTLMAPVHSIIHKSILYFFFKLMMWGKWEKVYVQYSL